MSLPVTPRQGNSPQLNSPFVARIDLITGCVELTGKLDYRTAHLVVDATAVLVPTGSPQWVLDVTGLTGCDHSGLRAIGAAYRKALRHDRRMTVVGAPLTLQAALARLRLDHHVLARDEATSAPDDRVRG